MGRFLTHERVQKDGFDCGNRDRLSRMCGRRSQARSKGQGELIGEAKTADFDACCNYNAFHI